MEPVTEAYKSLMHYTTASGLYGIVTGRTIWASQAFYLNDSEEITGYFDRRLVSVLTPTVEKALIRVKQDPDFDDLLGTQDGFAKQLGELVELLRNRLKEYMVEYHSPFIASLCYPSSERVLDHGLLSQWRGYGTDGGYALVFDAEALESRLRQEASTYLYQLLRWGDVQYEGMPLLAEVLEAEDALQKSVTQFILTNSDDPFEKALPALMYLATHFKHSGFSEEAELRIVAIPANDDVIEDLKGHGDHRAEKRVRYRDRSGLLVPFIELFDYEKSEPLPINQIIVGPHPDKEKRRRSVETLIRHHGYSAEVRVSDIPYLGR